jgi:hypothetical protein
MTFQEKADALFEDQLKSWPQLGTNWKLLDAAQVRQFDFDGFSIRVQFNPRRIISSAARVDRESIEKRPCFLCPNHRPPEEKGIWFMDRYELLCNPFPIFRKHYTIALSDHVPQVIEPELGWFLELSRALPDLALFYNAPNCGASAPDHMHFQAGNRGFMPIEQHINALMGRYGRVLHERPGFRLTAVWDGLRRFYVAGSDSLTALEGFGELAFGYLRELRGAEEPMINMLSYYSPSGWRILLFPRDRHRPWQYFEEGEGNILLSPASVDMGGTLITPLEKDFQKISKADIEDIFSQVTFAAGDFERMNEYLVTNL